MILTNSKGVIAEYALYFSFKASNNQVEFKAWLAKLKLAKELWVKSLQVFIDSQLIASQVIGEYDARDPKMFKYLNKESNFTLALKYFSIFHISR